MKTRVFLSELKIEFRKWRRQKHCRSERIPDDLLAKAIVAAEEYGRGRVGRALRIETQRLCRGGEVTVRAAPNLAVSQTPSVPMPTFTKIQVAIPRGLQPLLEAETPAGMKLRVFTFTPDTVAVLSSFCHVGGGP